jgi:hypothetical protein
MPVLTDYRYYTRDVQLRSRRGHSYVSSLLLRPYMLKGQCFEGFGKV